jgi:hypothetical protein
MAKLIINKPFVKDVMSKQLFKRFFSKLNQNNNVFFISTESVLNLLDKYWKYYYIYDKSYESTYLSDYNDIYLKKTNNLLDKNIISEEEYNILYNQIVFLTNDNIIFNPSFFHYEEVNDYYYLHFEKPLKLRNRWDNNINNPNNENIYLTYIDVYNKYYFPDTNEYRLATTYSYKLTDMQGDGDIRLDHIDKIDYIDSLILPLKAPKEINLN